MIHYFFGLSVSKIILDVVFGIIFIGTMAFKKMRSFAWIFLFWQLPLVVLNIFLGMHNQGTFFSSFSFIQIIMFSLTYLIAIPASYWFARKYSLIAPFKLHLIQPVLLLAGFVSILLGSFLANILSLIVVGESTTAANQAAVIKIMAALPVIFSFLFPIIAGYFEELIFRVGFFEVLFTKNKKIAFLFSFFLFALLHVIAGSLTDVHAWLSYGVMSFVFTAVYYKYRNFYLNASVHIVWNLFVTLISLLVKYYR
ncbi:MAG: CPBP family intramembrane metalloprotease [Streptococcaceae bacterium]|jgi:membrane protease YdiL (CAAX protease family)|nr:CPBP family intramembrane metalloprotease [Streptococcaceae bacterium]